MFAEFIKRLTQPDPAQLPDGDARLALTALLVRIAKSDNEYAPSERARIDQIIAKRYALDADGTASLRADAEALEAEAPDTVRFTRAIKDAVPYDDRLAVIKALWEVVLADGSLLNLFWTFDNQEGIYLNMHASRSTDHGPPGLLSGTRDCRVRPARRCVCATTGSHWCT